MYVGSSTGYNDTMSGETMSSISEKSGSYISDGVHEQQHSHHSHSHQHHHHRGHHIPQPHLLHTTAAAISTTEFEVCFSGIQAFSILHMYKLNTVLDRAFLTVAILPYLIFENLYRGGDYSGNCLKIAKLDKS